MKPRIDKPEPGNKYYINTNNGGYNRAEGNVTKLNKSLTSLPNCIAIYGWFNEVGGQGMKYLSTPWFPYTVIAAAKREGLQITKEPTLGGIMVWTGGAYGYGHVAGVAKMYPDDPNIILSAESEYWGVDWANYKRRRGNGNWADGCSWMVHSKTPYVYQGCIKNPYVEDEMTKEQTESLIRELVPKIIEDMEKEKAKLPPDDWAMEAVNMAIARDIMAGYPDGFHAQSPVRREELAQVVANMTRKE